MLNIPHYIRPYMSDKDRQFLNTLNRELTSCSPQSRYSLLDKYKVVNGMVIWHITTERNGKYRKLFKKYLKEYEEKVEG